MPKPLAVRLSLIGEVKKRPMLYNTSDTLNRSLKYVMQREKAWMCIAAKLGIASGPRAQLMWKRCRDKYSKRRRLGLVGNGKCALDKKLAFLDPFLTPKTLNSGPPASVLIKDDDIPFVVGANTRRVNFRGKDAPRFQMLTNEAHFLPTHPPVFEDYDGATINEAQHKKLDMEMQYMREEHEAKLEYMSREHDITMEILQLKKEVLLKELNQS